MIATMAACPPQEYGPRNSDRFKKALRNYVESFAAYSLVCYFLQIKDRCALKLWYRYASQSHPWIAMRLQHSPATLHDSVLA
jgi:hypothetical protein